MIVAGPPDGSVQVPAAVRRLAAGRRVEPVWRNELGGLAFRLGDDDTAEFVKWLPEPHAVRLAAESGRLRWAGRYTSVPAVLGIGTDFDGGWLQLAGLPGRNAVDAIFAGRPEVAVAAVGTGLRALHEALPVADCPYEWSANARAADARSRAAAGRLNSQTWKSEHRRLGVARALHLAGRTPPVDRLVVCHGDACLPNTLLDDDGQVTGHVDVGALGVADAWADLAVATWSVGWNYGPGLEDVLLDAYGIAPDPGRTAYYRLLWELGP